MRPFARAVGASVFGARAFLVDIQVSIYGPDESGEPAFRIVGLPDSALREGRERIRSAIAHGDWPWPCRAVTVNLAPAATRKEGAGLDLAIALGLLSAQGVLGSGAQPSTWLCIGELTLDGRVRAVRGVLAAAEAARSRGLTGALVPRGNAAEAAAVSGIQVVAVSSLAEAVGHLGGGRPLAPEEPRPWTPAGPRNGALIAVRGQETAVEAARIAAAGGHNLLLWGPPGAGKTLLSRQIRDWMPPLTYEGALEVSRIHSVAGLLSDGLVTRRPFRAPHHTTSLPGLVGGGSIPHPGEVSLAHLGVLFLDELAEFPRPALEALRQPLEEGHLVLGRARGRAAFPAEVLLVAATNPCPCGWRGVAGRCTCRDREVTRYQSRISGPLRDRFDLQVFVEPVDAGALVGRDAERPTLDASSLRRAWKAQERRQERYALPRAANARIPGPLLPEAAEPTPDARADLVRQSRHLGLTGRGVHRVIRVARTVADLAGSRRVEPEHVLRAISLRGQ